MYSPIVSFTQPTTKEGWREFVDRDPVVMPPVLTVPQFEALNETERARYGTERIQAVTQLAPIKGLYSDLQDLVFQRLELNNHPQPGARQGIVVDGLAANGKTTQVMEIGKAYEKWCRELYPERLTPSGHEFHPVIYVLAEAKSSTKTLNYSLNGFYGFVPKTASSQRLTQQFLLRAKQCQTSLIIIDDIHFLQEHRKSDIESNNHLKRLANDTRATFLYAGVNLQKNGFMREGKGHEAAVRSQLQTRFFAYPVEPIPAASFLLADLLQLFEKDFQMVRSEPGDLVKNKKFIWGLTNGVIGPIRNLLLGAFQTAIADGSERITKELLGKVRSGGLGANTPAIATD